MDKILASEYMGCKVCFWARVNSLKMKILLSTQLFDYCNFNLVEILKVKQIYVLLYIIFINIIKQNPNQSQIYPNRKQTVCIFIYIKIMHIYYIFLPSVPDPLLNGGVH